MARIGFHVSKESREMCDALREDLRILDEYELRPCVQIFVTGPRNTRETLTRADRAYIRELTARTPVLIHGAYIDNPWTRSANAAPNIRREMEIAAEIGADGVVVHLGAGARSDETLRVVLDDVGTVPDNVRANTRLYFEINAAKSSPATYETPEKIARLFERIDAVGTSLQCGLCVDSAHVFSCGVSMAEYEPTMEWLNALPDVPTVLHLNDSGSTLGSGVDRHEALLRGNIWGNYSATPGVGKLPVQDSGLAAILDYVTENEALTILERGDGLTGDLELVSALGYFKN